MLSNGPILMLLIAFVMSLSKVTYAEPPRIVTCKQSNETSIAWEFAGVLSKEGMKAEASNKVKDPLLLTFVIQPKRVFLKGNNGQVELKKLGDYLIEDTGLNLNFYRFFPADKDHKMYLISMKAYEMAGPVSFTSAFECE
jgi:hypothetical protein